MRRTLQSETKRISVVFLVLLSFSLAVAVPVPEEKMKAEEVIAKHLASIGSPEALAAAKTRIMVGDVKARLKISNAVRELVGPAQFASDGNRVLVAMALNATNYPYEKAGYDGDKITIAGLPTGGRSQLSSFLMSQDLIMKHGLLGGSLSSAWLMALEGKEGKLSYGGTEKIDGRETYRLKYEPKKGTTKVNLYFDAETFRHVRSDYQYTVSAYMGRRPQASVGVNTPTGGVSRFQLIEEFSDFKPTGKLTLPHTYKIQVVIEATAQNLEYNMSFSQFVFDQAIDPASFNVAASR